MPIKIAFDIGGVLTKYPNQMKAFIRALSASAEFEVHILTDMNATDAERMCAANGIIPELVARDRLHTADWVAHNDLCKAVKVGEVGIDILVDDRLDYLHQGAAIGLLVVPRPGVPYCSPDWRE